MRVGWFRRDRRADGAKGTRACIDDQQSPEPGRTPPGQNRDSVLPWDGGSVASLLDVDDLAICLTAADVLPAAEEIGAGHGGALLERLPSIARLDADADLLTRPGAADAREARALGDARPGLLGDSDLDLREGRVAGDLQRHVHRGALGNQRCRRLDVDVEEQPSGEKRDRWAGGREQGEQAAEN